MINQFEAFRLLSPYIGTIADSQPALIRDLFTSLLGMLARDIALEVGKAEQGFTTILFIESRFSNKFLEHGLVIQDFMTILKAIGFVQIVDGNDTRVELVRITSEGEKWYRGKLNEWTEKYEGGMQGGL